MGRIAPRDFPGAEEAADVVSEEEQTDNTRNGRKPGAVRFSGDESFPKVDDATNPENLADNQHHEKGEEEQKTERTHLAPTGGQPEGAKGNQRETDHAPDQVLVSSEESDHRRCDPACRKRDYRLGANCSSHGIARAVSGNKSTEPRFNGFSP